MRLVNLTLILAACGGAKMSGAKSGSSGTYGTWGASSTAAETPLQVPDDTPPSDTAAPPCDVEDDVALFVSPDDSNSVSSPEQARDAVLADGAVEAPLREWEFFNYYRFPYPAADPGELRVSADLVAGAEAGQYVLQVGIASETVSPAGRAPLNLTFVLDNSGSMSGGPNARLKEVCDVIAGQLLEGDVVSMVTWNTDQNVILSGHAVSGPNDPGLLAAIAAVDASGGTDLANGLRTGYELAAENQDSTRINRVILISDGGANVGVTDEDLIGSYAGNQDEDGIYLVGVGVGDDGGYYNDVLMNTVTDVGKGASLYIGRDGEAEAMFGDRFLENMGVAARNVQISYDLPPGFRIVQFSGEELSTQQRDVEPQHIAPNDAMVLHQTLETCSPEAVTADSPIAVHVAWQDAITFEPRETAFESTFGELLAQDAPLLRKGDAVSAYVKALRDVRDGASGSAASVGLALAAIATARADGADPDLDEMESVLNAL